jgi:putative ABC transport system substrate-binding protein
MDRRALIRSAFVLIGAPFFAHAQAPRPAGKIGYLSLDPIAASSAALGNVSLLRPAWQRLGYVEGETMLLRFAERDAQRLPGLVAELIALKVGVLIVVGGEAVRIVSRVAKVPPIVALDLETDPVRSALAASFARPGGNVTGLFMDHPALAGKWIELLREAAPTIERVALLWDRGTGRDQLEIGQAAARAKGLEPLVIEFSAVTDFDDALRGLGRRPPTGIVVLTSPRFPRRDFAAAAQKHRLPSISFQVNQVQAGVLMSYGPNREAYFPRTVVLADKILKGEKPGDIPIEQPTQFELAINLKTAKAIGITIPQSLLLRADEVIE